MIDTNPNVALVLPNGVFGVRNLWAGNGERFLVSLGMTGGVAALEASIQQGLAELREMLA